MLMPSMPAIHIGSTSVPVTKVPWRYCGSESTYASDVSPTPTMSQTCERRGVSSGAPKSAETAAGGHAHDPRGHAGAEEDPREPAAILRRGDRLADPAERADTEAEPAHRRHRGAQVARGRGLLERVCHDESGDTRGQLLIGATRQ